MVGDNQLHLAANNHIVEWVDSGGAHAHQNIVATHFGRRHIADDELTAFLSYFSKIAAFIVAYWFLENDMMLMFAFL